MRHGHISPFAPITREAAVLRLLARFEFVPARHIHALVGGTTHPVTLWRVLQTLHRQRLIWRHPIDSTRLPGARGASNNNPPPRLPMLYGLTAQGRSWLETQGAEDDPAVLDRAIVRDWRQPDVKLGQLAHDLLVIDWCCHALSALRASPRTRLVEVVLEYVSASTETGHPLQRIDALIVVQVDPHPREQLASASPSAIPWGWPPRDAPGSVAWALELDRGTEKLVTLLGKAVMYRDLTLSGHYAATLGCPLLPVVVTPTARRAMQIAIEWLHGWPDGRGVVTHHGAITDSRGGVLWGRYKAMGVSPAPDATLWDDLGIAHADWESTNILGDTS